MMWSQSETMFQYFWGVARLFYLLLVPVILIWYITWRISRRHMYKLARKIPGPEGLPFFGSALDFKGRSPDLFTALQNNIKDYKSEDTVKIWLGPQLFVFLYNPDDLEVLLKSYTHLDKSEEYKFLKPWLGEGLLISTGAKWFSHRKLIAPTFHQTVNKSFIDIFNQNCNDFVNALKKETGVFDCHDYLVAWTVKILLETAMGVNKSEISTKEYNYANAVLKLSEIVQARQLKIWLRPDVMFNFTKYAKMHDNFLNIVHEMSSQVIKSRKANRSNNQTTYSTGVMTDTSSSDVTSPYKDDLGDDEDVGQKKRLAFLDQLIESAQNGSNITDEVIKEQVDTIMFEGHDTIASGGSFFLSLMGIHKEIQDKIVEELHQIFGDSDRPATYKDTLEMKYLERCLLETLRLYPPVPVIARNLKEDLTLPSNGLKVPTGSTVIIEPYGLHRRKAFLPNPDKFDPDNFLPDRCANRHFYAYIPFAAGPRSCVGRKYAMLLLKILLSTVLRNFEVCADYKESDFRLRGDIILKREEGFKIRLEPRQKLAKL